MRPAQEAYNWIKKVIDSCENTFHFDGADALIELFVKRHPEETNLIMFLQTQRSERFKKVHSILS